METCLTSLRGDQDSSLQDQQRHLMALFNFVLKKSATRLEQMRKRKDSLMQRSKDQILGLSKKDMDKFLIAWSQKLMEAIERANVIPQLLDCSLPEDSKSLSLLVKVSNIHHCQLFLAP